MKIDRRRLLSAIEYIRQVNDTDFDSLDFSEFFDVDDPEYKEMKEQFKTFGLANKDFITMYRDKWKHKLESLVKTAKGEKQNEA